MKLAKILILALGLTALAATASFANVNFISSAGQRNLAVNAETGMTSTILLSATGPVVNAVVPMNESIFLTYSVPISMLSDVYVRVKDATTTLPFTAYGDAGWVDIGTYARARVGLSATDYNNIQIQFLEDVSFASGESIEVGGVRVNTVPDLGMAPGAVVTVDFTNAIGEAVVTNGEDLPVAILREPLTISPITAPPISFLADGTVINDVATTTITELFTNAFETQTVNSQIRITVTNVPSGVKFSGIAGVYSDDPDISAYNCSNPFATLICINSQNESLLEHIDVGLWFEMTDPAAFTPANATVNATLYPPLAAINPLPSAPPLRYEQRIVSGDVDFGLQRLIYGKLLSVFNAVGGSLDTGVGIMNGSSAGGLPPTFARAGAITVNMYPMDGSGPYSFTTSDTMKPGLGLDANGQLIAKGTWAVLVSQLIPYAENADEELLPEGDFEGFIIFQCDFPNAEGVSYISDWVTQAQGYPMINLIRRDAEDLSQSQIQAMYDSIP